LGLATLTVGWAGTAHAVLIDVTQPGDEIELVNGVNDDDGNAGAPPGGEGVEHAIDNVGQKYLNFLDLGSGFIVTPTLGADTGGTIVTSLRLFTANDAEERDPASFVLEGAASAGGPFTLIAEGDLNLPSGRNNGGATPLADLTNSFTVAFSNTTAYLSYRLTFPTLKNAPGANSMQIGEVEFLAEFDSTAVPAPAAGLLGLGFVGALVMRRRRSA
jgi:hypothetical protein